MSLDNTARGTTVRTLTIQGVRAGVGLDPDEIFVDFPLASPRYFRVRKGGVVQEGDARTRTAAEMEGVRLTKWEVVDITPDTVVGRDVETGEEVRWERDWLENRLARGAFSTELTGFERVAVFQSGSWAEATDDSGASESTTDPTVTVLVYGNDGGKYTRTYRFAERGNETDVQLAEESTELIDLDGERREALEAIVDLALRQEGYAVGDAQDTEAEETA